MPYTNAELEALSDTALPERGVYCPKCRNFIPAFSVIDVKNELELRKQGLAAMWEIHRLTGCNMRFAKIWAIHPHGPHPERQGTPCPYCGKPLFSDDTRQCIQCGWDWHDPAHPVQHVVNLRPELAKSLEAQSANPISDR